jgi:GNAT superfamily N-acetyltransferase
MRLEKKGGVIMNYHFEASQFAALSGLVQKYLVTLSSPIDSFLEDHILGSQFYTIAGEGKLRGYLALHEQKLLTQFYIEPEYLSQGQPIFRQLLSQFKPEAAFVPTCDEFFLSHALDQEITLKKQAYFFQDCREIEVDSKIYRPGQFRPASEGDRAEIVNISGDFFDRLGERIARREIFVFREGEALLGVGIVEKGKLLPRHASIGMFTHEQHRQKGVGRSLIIHLKRWCYTNGFVPVAGCWYYNYNSKKTLESAGMITRTRLLRLEFTGEAI